MSSISTASLWRNIQTSGARDFLVLPKLRMRFTDLSNSVSCWLQHFDIQGVQSGDRVVILSSHEPALVSCFIASILDGVVPVILAADTPSARVEAILEFVEAKCLILDADTAWNGSVKLGTKSIILVKFEKSGRLRSWGRTDVDPFTRLPPVKSNRAPRLPDTMTELAYILFTSGTTASPSGVVISRANLFSQLQTLSRLFGYTPKSRIFNDLILAHADGMIQGPMLALANACAVIRSGGFTIPGMEAWLDRVREERATHVIAVPTMWALIDNYARHDDYFDAPECGLLISVAAKLSADLWSRIEERFKRPVCNQYGLTETVASALYAGPCAEMGAKFSVGVPVDCEARIDPASLDPRQGELQLRGENIFPGYWRNDERTQKTFTNDGWMKTGDLACLYDNGSFDILGRLKSVIMTGGFLIRPDEIDEVMLTHPDVVESVTIAQEDELFGEVPVTAVTGNSVLLEAELTRHARQRLEAKKVPKRIVHVSAIPRGISGKPNFSELDALLRTHMEPREGDNNQESDVVETVLKIASDIFRVDVSNLTLASGSDDIEGWDSFSELNFLMEIERHFGISIPLSRAVLITSIQEMVQAVETAQP